MDWNQRASELRQVVADQFSAQSATVSDYIGQGKSANDYANDLYDFIVTGADYDADEKRAIKRYCIEIISR